MTLKVRINGQTRQITGPGNSPVTFVNGAKKKLVKGVTFINGAKKVLWDRAQLKIDEINISFPDSVSGTPVPVWINNNSVYISTNGNTAPKLYKFNIENTSEAYFVSSVEYGNDPVFDTTADGRIKIYVAYVKQFDHPGQSGTIIPTYGLGGNCLNFSANGGLTITDAVSIDGDPYSSANYYLYAKCGEERIVVRKFTSSEYIPGIGTRRHDNYVWYKNDVKQSFEGKATRFYKLSESKIVFQTIAVSGTYWGTYSVDGTGEKTNQWMQGSYNLLRDGDYIIRTTANGIIKSEFENDAIWTYTADASGKCFLIGKSQNVYVVYDNGVIKMLDENTGAVQDSVVSAPSFTDELKNVVKGVLPVISNNNYLGFWLNGKLYRLTVA